MKRTLWAAFAAFALCAPAVAGGGGLGEGDRAPWPEARETIGISTFSPKEVEGKVVLYEVFRTW